MSPAWESWNEHCSSPSEWRGHLVVMLDLPPLVTGWWFGNWSILTNIDGDIFRLNTSLEEETEGECGLTNYSHTHNIEI